MRVKHYLAPALVFASLTIPAALALSQTTYGVVLKPGVTKATLTWAPPKNNTDGSQLKNLSAINIYRGPSSRELTRIYTAKAGVSEYTATGLKAGVHYFALRSVNAAGEEGPQILIGPVVVQESTPVTATTPR